MNRPQDPVGPPTVTARVAAILLALAARPRLSVSEVAGVVRLPLSTTHRLLSALVTYGVVERTAQARYELRLDAAQRGHNPSRLRADISAMITDLADVTGFRVRFGVWHERGVSALTQQGGRLHAAVSPRTERLPVHATALGKAMLAFAPDQEVRRVLARPLARYTEYTLSATDELRAALAKIRACGMAVAMCEFHVDEWALAVPVFAPNGVIASLEVSGRGALSEAKRITPVLQFAARTLGRGLSEYPIWLPTGAGRAPLRWPIDPTSRAACDDDSPDVTPIAAAGGDGSAYPGSACARRSLSPVRNVPRRA